jgi:mannose-6-phosphate isomerase
LVRSAEKKSVLAECREFSITRHRLAEGENLAFGAGEQARILSVVSGNVAAGDISLVLGDNVLLPQDGSFTFVARPEAVVLVTENFSSLD